MSRESSINVDECLEIADSYSWPEIVHIGKVQGIDEIELKRPNKLYAIIKIKEYGGQISTRRNFDGKVYQF